MQIIHPMQQAYIPKPDGYVPIPLSVLGSGPIRRVITRGTQEAFELAKGIQWDKYKCTVKGVRWHPNGSWRVQFCRRNYEHNFFVNVNCYFRVGQHGFEGAKQLAISYRRRLEREWLELVRTWQMMDRSTGNLCPRARRLIPPRLKASRKRRLRPRPQRASSRRRSAGEKCPTVVPWQTEVIPFM